MIKVEVFHHAFGANGRHVATVLVPNDGASDLEALEIAFESTNTIDDEWWNNENVESHRENWGFPHGTRSTSVGDFATVIRVDGVKVNYECAFVGWERVLVGD